MTYRSINPFDARRGKTLAAIADAEFEGRAAAAVNKTLVPTVSMATPVCPGPWRRPSVV